MGMSVPAELHSEFDLFESEDLLQPGSPLQFVDDADTLHAFDTTNFKNHILSPGEFLVSTPPTTSPDSANDSFQDSCSDSASSKRTASSTPSNPASHSGDVAMADGPPVKPEWPSINDDFNFRDDDAAFTFDGTINPSTLEANIDAFGFGDKFTDHGFDFESASSSPSPFANKAEMPSPELPNKPNPVISTRKTATAVSKQKRHAKAHSQFSLTQGMNGLNTNGSREVSPLSNMVSQESSPGAAFNSPSPGSSIDFISAAALNAAPVYPQPMDMGSFVPMPFARTIPMNRHETAQMAGMQFQIYHPHVQPPKLTIHPTPFKSRVETQIPIRMSIYPLPPGIKRLHLPTHTISKPKLLARPPPERSPDMLELYTALVCTSAMQDEEKRKKALARAARSSHMSPRLPEDLSEDDENKPQNGGEVRICGGCITRERKRAARKKIKKVEEEELWSRDEHRRVIVFNTQEIKEWQPATSMMGEGAIMNRPEPSLPPGAFQVECPMRIACYCRHQNEKQGFQVIFTLKDYRDRVVAQEMSNSIMITDDHKTHTPPILSGQTTSDAVNVTTPATFHQSQPPSMAPAKQPQFAAPPTSVPAPASLSNPPAAISRNLSRPASPSSSVPSAKKRKASGSIKVPTSLAMTPRDVPPVAAPAAVTQASPFTPSVPTLPLSDGMFSGPISQPFATSPSTPNNNDQVFFNPNSNRNASMDAMAMPNIYSAPTSAHPSRAPSPNGLRNSVNAAHHAQLAQAVTNGLYQLPMSFNPQRPATIHKIIPNEGPKSGGVEVTILGSGFYPGLEVMFGDQKATTTTFWGETSLVCLLPPSPISGTVLVTFKQQPLAAPNPFASMAKQQSTFKYIDDDEHQLIRSALAVLGQKMTGKMEDARDLARRILGDGSSWGSGGSGGPSSQQPGGGGFNSLSFNTATETQLLKVLELIDLDDSPRQCRLDMAGKVTGQTMLHLACALGLHRLVAGLLSRGADPDVQDKGKFTPMHLAAMNGHLEIVRRLVSAGANPTLRSISGLTPSEIAPKSIARGIRKIERHARSLRGRSLHSRVNSATSLRSLWEGPLRSSTDESDGTRDGTPSEESLEYSEYWDSEEPSDADDGQLIGLRRNTLKDGTNAKRFGEAEANAGLLSPTAAMIAWKEQMTAQLQQLQQAMTMSFQNLAQFPSLPPMLAIQEYQANVAVQQGMRKLAALMQNIARPGSADGNVPDSKWWDALFTSSAAPTTSPPAYEDLYPQQDLDKKQSSAAQAAAEAEADMKCASIYDDASETTSQTSSGESTPRRQLPALLQVGRRHAITEEQRKNLQQLHAEKFTRVSKDSKLFFIWIPLLLIVLCAFLNNTFPSLFAGLMSFVISLATGANTGTVRNDAERNIEVQ